jgi:cell division protein FtsB
MAPRRNPGGPGDRGPRARAAGRPTVGAARSESVRSGPVRSGTGRSAAARSGAGRPAAKAKAKANTNANRPAGVRRPSGGATAKRTRAPQPGRFTGRAAVLGMVLIGLLLAYAYPVRVYLAQQAEITGLEQRQAEQRRRIGEKTEERRKWDDDEFLKAKAKKELHYVLPGETPYITLPDPATAGAPSPSSSGRSAPEQWYHKLWSSVDAADRVPGS